MDKSPIEYYEIKTKQKTKIMTKLFKTIFFSMKINKKKEDMLLNIFLKSKMLFYFFSNTKIDNYFCNNDKYNDKKEYYLPHIKYNINYSNCDSINDILSLTNLFDTEYKNYYVESLKDFFGYSKIYFKWCYEFFIPSIEDYINVLLKRSQFDFILQIMDNSENLSDNLLFFKQLLVYFQILNDYSIFSNLYCSEFDIYEPNYVISYANEKYKINDELKKIIKNLNDTQQKINLVKFLNDKNIFDDIYDILILQEKKLLEFNIIKKSDFKLIEYDKIDVENIINYYNLKK